MLLVGCGQEAPKVILDNWEDKIKSCDTLSDLNSLFLSSEYDNFQREFPEDISVRKLVRQRELEVLKAMPRHGMAEDQSKLIDMLINLASKLEASKSSREIVPVEKEWDDIYFSFWGSWAASYITGLENPVVFVWSHNILEKASDIKTREQLAGVISEVEGIRSSLEEESNLQDVLVAKKRCLSLLHSNQAVISKIHSPQQMEQNYSLLRERLDKARSLEEILAIEEEVKGSISKVVKQANELQLQKEAEREFQDVQRRVLNKFRADPSYSTVYHQDKSYIEREINNAATYETLQGAELNTFRVLIPSSFRDVFKNMRGTQNFILAVKNADNDLSRRLLAATTVSEINEIQSGIAEIVRKIIAEKVEEERLLELNSELARVRRAQSSLIIQNSINQSELEYQNRSILNELGDQNRQLQNMNQQNNLLRFNQGIGY